MRFEGVCSAPGKVIISGEHAAVYGHPVLCTAIDKFLECKYTAVPASTQKLLFKSSDKLIDTSVDIELNESKLLEFVLGKFERVPGFTLTVEVVKCEIPVSAGLGSSAAYAACLAASLCSIINKLVGDEYEEESLDDLIAGATNYMEKLMHGNPSGVDAACVLAGGTIGYHLKQPPEITEINKLDQCFIDKLNWFIVFTGK